MAHILPDTPPQTLPAEVLRTFRALKTLPDDFYVWHHLAPWQLNTPDFLVIHEDGRVLLLKVSPALSRQARPVIQLELIEDTRTPLGQSEAKILDAFITSLKFPADQLVETLVLFPNIPDEQVQASRLKRVVGDPQWAGKELLQAETGAVWNTLLPSSPMDGIWLEKLRQRFTPEVVVPAEMTVRMPVDRRIEAGLTAYLLDYNQESAVKSDLDIPSESLAITTDFRLNIINGVAGSGKTLILLYRLRLLYHLYPEKHYLVLTHNRPLNHDMQGRFARLDGELPINIEWCTFNGWCFDHWPKGMKWVDPLSQKERQVVLDDVWHKHLKDTIISVSMFRSEIDWLKDQPPSSRKDYLVMDRRGRGFGLNTEQRQKMYDALLAYQKSLKEQQILDWGDVPRCIWQSMEQGKLQLPQYDVILVDEAQFFAPLWIKIIQRVINLRNGHLFIVADPTQGFLGRGTSWKSFGLEARGRTHHLRFSYRTTREIMQFATLLYRLRLAEEKDEDILAPDLYNMPNGSFPQIIPLTSPQDEITRVANEVENFVRQGCPKRDLLLLHAEGKGVNSLIQAINDRLGKDAAIDPKDTYPGDYVRVTTLNAGAGLESPIVFLSGVRHLFEEEQSLRLSDDERETLVRDNTRKLYMAATRAGQRLVLTYVGELPDSLNQMFKVKVAL
jgi:hypothetical protein